MTTCQSQLSVAPLCQALCEAWLTAGGQADMTPGLLALTVCGGDTHEGNKQGNAHPVARIAMEGMPGIHESLETGLHTEGV